MPTYDDVSPGFVITVVSTAPEPRVGGATTPLGQVLERMTDVTERVESFVFEDAEREADVLKLQVDNSDLYFFDHPAWVKGNFVRFYFGYPGRIFGPRVHVIDSVRGFLKLDITAVEEVALSNVADGKLHQNKTRAQIVLDLVREGAFPGVINVDVEAVEGEEARDWQQSRQTDWQFLQRLAEDPGYEVFIEGDTLHFHPRRMSAPPVRRFEYFYGIGDFLDFNLKEWRTADRPGEAAVMGRDPIERENLSASGNDAKTERDVLGNQNSLVIKRNVAGSLVKEEAKGRVAGKTIDPSPDVSGKDLSQQADAKFRLQEQREIEATVKILGDPLLPAKSIVELVGISAQLSGKYYVEKAIHEIGKSGYTTTLEVVRNAVTQTPSSEPPSLDPVKATENAEAVPSDRRKTIVRDDITGTLIQK